MEKREKRKSTLCVAQGDLHFSHSTSFPLCLYIRSSRWVVCHSPSYHNLFQNKNKRIIVFILLFAKLSFFINVLYNDMK